MKKLFAFLAASIMMLSCSKDAEQLSSPNTKRMTRVNYENGNYAEVSYFADGKVKQVVTKSGPYLYTKTFTHSAGKVSYLSTLAGKKNEIGEFIIANGKVTDFTWTYFDANEAPISTFHETFEYNAQGLLSKRTFNNGPRYDFLYNPEGDLIEAIYFDGNGTAIEKYVYTYTGSADKFPWFSEDNDSGFGFLFPARSKHLRKTEKKINLPGGTVGYEYDITHELDKDGYVTKSVFNLLQGGSGSYTVSNSYE